MFPNGDTGKGSLLTIHGLGSPLRSYSFNPTKILAIQVGVVLLASALFSVWITAADTALSNPERNAATLVYNKTYDKGRRVWFVEHWGFQSYLESLGVAPLDLTASSFRRLGSDCTEQFTFCRGITSVHRLKRGCEIAFEKLRDHNFPRPGHHFYASSWGPIPCAIGPVPSEGHSIIRLGTLPGQGQSQ
jgi:hypothetical protein